MNLIIGASSFIGGHLLNELRAGGREVACTHLNVLQSEDGAYQLDILDRKRCLDLLAEIRPKVVFHLAAQTIPRESWLNPQNCYRVNIEGTANVAEACATLDEPPLMVFPSSAHVYGTGAPSDRGIREDDTCCPTSPYGIAKLAAEQHLKAVGGDGFRFVIFRLFNQFGPGQVGPFFIPEMVEAIRTFTGQTSLQIETGNLQLRRDFLDVRDAVRALAMVAVPECASVMAGKTYNLGRGEASPLAEVLQMLLDASKSDATQRTDPARLRPNDPPALWADISKLEMDTDWRPERGLKDSLAELVSAG